MLAYDMRGHGRTTTGDDTDLSTGTLVADLLAVIAATCEGGKVVLVGHSLGGALVVRAAAQHAQDFQLAGVCVLDLVEGSAIAVSISLLQSFLSLI